MNDFTDVVAVIVVSNDDQLLRDGACGAMPPMVCRHPNINNSEWHVFDKDLNRSGFMGWALPLWWDGAIVPEGVDRASRAARGDNINFMNHCVQPRNAEDTRNLGLYLIRERKATKVICLKRDQEGRLVYANIMGQS